MESEVNELNARLSISKVEKLANIFKISAL